MEPIIFKRLGIAMACLLLLPLGSNGVSDGPALIATLAGDLPTDSMWDCTAAGVGLMWSSPNGAEHPVAVDFIAACDPAFDFEGRMLFFSGRRTEAEGFRIWRQDLKTNEISALTPDGLQARSPFALPDGAVGFISDGEIWRRSGETTRIEQLTFTRSRTLSAAALPDGRILYLLRSVQGGRLFTMLPDGTWSTLWPGLDELSIRDFTIVDSGYLLVLDTSTDLWLVPIADPFAARKRISVDLGGVILGLNRADKDGAFVVAEMGGKSPGLSTRSASLGFEPEPRLSELGAFGDGNLLAVASAGPAPRVDFLPSIVNPEMRTGFVFVIDVARTDDPELAGLDRDEIAQLKIYRLEESGSKTVLFSVEPAGDGSVYVEAPANTPMALELVDRQGTVLASSHTPIWIRPNERRGCIGCHVSPAYAPPNVRPEALVQEPHRLGSDDEVSP